MTRGRRELHTKHRDTSGTHMIHVCLQPRCSNKNWKSCRSWQQRGNETNVCIWKLFGFQNLLLVFFNFRNVAALFSPFFTMSTVRVWISCHCVRRTPTGSMKCWQVRRDHRAETNALSSWWAKWSPQPELQTQSVISRLIPVFCHDPSHGTC